MQNLDSNATFKILKIMESALIHGEDTFQRIQGVAGIFNESGNILKGNIGLSNILNTEIDLIHKKSLNDLLDDKNVTLFKTVFSKLKNNSKVKELKIISPVKIKNMEGEYVTLNWNISFLKEFKDRNQFTFLVTGSDITDLIMYQKKIEAANAGLEQKVKERTKDLESALEELKQMQIQMVQNARMSSLGEMAGNMAHEINNPLNVISLSIQSLSKALLKDGFKNEKIDRLVTKISTNIKRMGEIIQSLKGFSRDASTDPMKLYKVGEILDDSLFAMKEKFTSNQILLEVNSASLESTELFCNKVAINQCIVNLLSNSFDVVKNQNSGEKFVKFGVTDLGEFLEFYVIDSGPGVPLDIQEKIYEPFFTTKELGAGTGLGLSMAKGIVEKQHKGKLFYKKEYPPACFVIQIPKDLEVQGQGEKSDLF